MLGLFSGELIFGGAYYWKEFCVSKWVRLDNKTASTNSPWAYIREGLLSEGFLLLRLWGGGLILGRAYLFICFFFLGGGLLSEFYGIMLYQLCSSLWTSHCLRLYGACILGRGGVVRRDFLIGTLWQNLVTKALL